MKAIYVGTFLQRHVSDNYRASGMEQAGIHTHKYDYRKVAKKFGGAVGMNNHLVELCDSMRPDLVLINKGELIMPETILKIKAVVPDTFVVWWYGDQRGVADVGVAARVKHADMFLINNHDEDQMVGYMKLGVPHVDTWHSATDPEVFKPARSGTPAQVDVVFLGGNYSIFPKSRMRLALIRRLSLEFETVVHGGRWPADIYQSGLAYGADFSKACWRAKVVLGINAYDKIDGYTSNRTWNSMATGVPLVTHRFAGIKKIFGKNGDKLVWFDTIDEAVKRIGHLINDDDERRIIGEHARTFILGGHTYKHRAEELLKMIDQTKRGRDEKHSVVQAACK